MGNLIIARAIEKRIFLIRGKRVMLDSDLAELYQVPTGRLNEQVKRNCERFPGDFMFQLTQQEYEQLSSFMIRTNLISQFAISSLPAGKVGWGGRRKMPFVFTEQGVAMLSSVLKSKRAIKVNILIMRTFIRLRQILSTHKKIAEKLREIELETNKNKSDIKIVFDALHQLLALPEEPKKKIGFLR